MKGLVGGPLLVGGLGPGPPGPPLKSGPGPPPPWQTLDPPLLTSYDAIFLFRPMSRLENLQFEVALL